MCQLSLLFSRIGHTIYSHIWRLLYVQPRVSAAEPGRNMIAPFAVKLRSIISRIGASCEYSTQQQYIAFLMPNPLETRLSNSCCTNVGSTQAMPDAEPIGNPTSPQFCMSWNEGYCVGQESLVDFAMHATSVAAENPTAESTIGPSNVGTGEILQNALANGQLQDQNTNNDVNNLLSLIPSSFFTLNLVKVNFSPRVSLANSLSMWTI